ncbi:MAG TPA: hypothetical protein VFI17_09620 [Solirubrobacterales bacterium]|nr:hypothetical protein [Solirubrobacterales bacterium]
MIRNKVWSLALVAMLAMSAMVASSAMAEPTLQNKENKNVTLKGKLLSGTFTIDGSSVECTTGTLNALGETADGSTNATLHPEVSGCNAFGFIGATVSTTGCNYRGMAKGTVKEMFFNSGELQVECEAGKAININASTCSASIGSQTVTTGVDFSNTTAEQNGDGFMDFDIHTTNSPVAVTKNADGFGCPFSGTGATTATGNATWTVQCFIGGVQVDCTIE